MPSGRSLPVLLQAFWSDPGAAFGPSAAGSSASTSPPSAALRASLRWLCRPSSAAPTSRVSGLRGRARLQQPQWPLSAGPGPAASWAAAVKCRSAGCPTMCCGKAFALEPHCYAWHCLGAGRQAGTTQCCVTQGLHPVLHIRKGQGPHPGPRTSSGAPCWQQRRCAGCSSAFRRRPGRMWRACALHIPSCAQHPANPAADGAPHRRTALSCARQLPVHGASGLGVEVLTRPDLRPESHPLGDVLRHQPPALSAEHKVGRPGRCACRRTG